VRDEELEALIQKHNPGVDIIECAHKPQYLQRFGTTEQQPLAYLKGRRVAAFSGIATPESFEKFLRDLGAKLVARERYLDHYRYADEDFDDLFALAQKEGAECLVTTEKDAVRIPADRVCRCRFITCGWRSISCTGRRTLTKRWRGFVSRKTDRVRRCWSRPNGPQISPCGPCAGSR
jgi:tetraacyldisaccharide-1-P 4'-kinase